MSIRRENVAGHAFDADFIAGLGAAGPSVPTFSISATSLRANPAFMRLVSDSISRSVVSDEKMWTLDAAYTAASVSAAVCTVRSEVFPYRPGACGSTQIGCQHSTFELAVPCTPSNSQELMWQLPRYTWAQAKLRAMLANKPAAYPTKARAAAWAQWCLDVAALVSLARWSTNIRNSVAGKLIPGSSGTSPAVWDSTPYILPIEGDRAAAWQARLQAARSRIGTEYGGGPVFMPIEIRDLNTDARSLPRSKADFQPVDVKWPVSWRDPLGTRPNSLGVQQPYRTESRPSGTLAALTRLFELSTERELLVPATFSVVSRRSSVVNGSYVSPEGLVGYLEAVAQDAVIDRSYAKWVSHGIKVWNDAFVRIPGDYRRDMLGSLEQFAQLAVLANEAKADEAFMAMQAGLSAAGGIASTIPVVGWAAGLMIAVMQALLTLAHEILKATDSYATGAGAIPVCPPPPVLRIIRGGQACNWDDPSRDGARVEEVERSIVAALGPSAASTGAVTSPNAILPRYDTVGSSSSTAGGASGKVLLGAGALALALFSMRKR